MYYFLALSSLTSLFFYSFANQVLAAANDCSNALGCPPAGVEAIETLFARVIGISVGAAFIALVVVLVIAGIKFITSGGDAKSLSAASQAIVWGLLGILFMALAWLILQLIAAFTGIDALKFFNLQSLPQS